VDRDALEEALDHGPLLGQVHSEPVAGKVPGLAHDVLLHDGPDFEEVDLPLEVGGLG